MSSFKIVKKGYSQLEVDSYIERLKNDYESRLAEQKDRIFYLKDQLDKLTNSTDNELMTSLLSAVEKAKLIENSSKNIYELETKKLNLLYSKMENLLKDTNASNDVEIKNELLNTIQDCRRSLQNNIEMQSKNMKESTSGDPVKRLLTKMMGAKRIVVDDMFFEEEKQKESPYQSSIQQPVKKETQEKQVEIKREIKRETPEFEKFLSNDSKSTNGVNFESILFSPNSDLAPNESGFDLKEAVNPKEDLDEIMKAFDFYNDIKSDESNAN